MTKTSNRESAKIYEFPAGGRAGLGKFREGTNAMPLSSPRVAKVAVTSGWYHEQAVQEEARKR